MKSRSLLLSSCFALALVGAAQAAPFSGTLPCGEEGFVVHAFDLEDASQIELLMSSDEIDSYLRLFAVGEGEGPGRMNLVAEDDDGGGGLNSLISMRLQPGSYRLVASSFDGEGGAYQLSGRKFKAGPMELVHSVIGDLADGKKLKGDAAPADGMLGDRTLYEVRINLPNAGRLQVDVLALDQTDALLLLTDAEGTMIAMNDDELTIQHSRVTEDLEAGDYIAWVTTSSDSAPAAGEFVLNATFRVIEDQADLQLRLAPEDAKDIVELMEGGEVAGDWRGEEVPGFELPVVGGNQMVSLEDLRGRLVLLDFWEPWCAPCLQTMPHLDRLQRELGESHKLTVIGIGSSAPDRLQAEIERLGVSYQQVHDPGGATAQAYGVTAIPRMILVGPEGVAYADLTGAHSYEALLRLIESVAQGDEPGRIGGAAAGAIIGAGVEGFIRELEIRQLR